MSGLGYYKTRSYGASCYVTADMLANTIELFANHEESINELSKSLIQIANILPMNNVIIELYPDAPQIRRSAQMVYELLIGHFREMLNFYKEKPWKKVFNNVFKPFKVRFEERLKMIDAYSHSMSLLAGALAHRDDRNAHAMQIGLLNQILDICLSE